MIFSGETGDELVEDLVAVIMSMAARIYGCRQSKRRAEKIKQCVEHAVQEEDEHEGDTRVQDRTGSLS